MPFVILPHVIQASSEIVATLFMLHPVIAAVLLQVLPIVRRYDV